jgi:hypothetical protein
MHRTYGRITNFFLPSTSCFFVQWYDRNLATELLFMVCPCCICVKSWKVVVGFNQFISIHFLLLKSFFFLFPLLLQKKCEDQEHQSEVHGVVRRIKPDAPDGLPVNQAMNWPQAVCSPVVSKSNSAGVVLRNANGSFLTASARWLSAASSALVTEAEACQDGLRLVLSRPEFRIVVLETNLIQFISLWNSQWHQLSEIAVIPQEMEAMIRRFLLSVLLMWKERLIMPRPCVCSASISGATAASRRRQGTRRSPRFVAGSQRIAPPAPPRTWPRVALGPTVVSLVQASPSQQAAAATVTRRSRQPPHERWLETKGLKWW